MPSFPKPKQLYPYVVGAEVAALRLHKAVRAVPAKAAGDLLVGTWNIANLGAQLRETKDLQLIAELLSWFDVTAVQECRDNFADLVRIVNALARNSHEW